MAEANLIITYDPSHAGSAKEEVDNVLKEIKKKAKHLKSEIDGVFKVNVPNTKKVVKELNKLCKKDSSLFNHTFHWVPVDKWVKTNIKEMQKEIKKFDKGIKKTEKWMMDLNKRHYDKEGTTELIMKLTEVIDKPKVDLKNPQKIVKVEIMGNKAGLSLLDIDELLKVPKQEK